MRVGYYHNTNLIYGSQHVLLHESFFLIVTIIEIHILILDVCVSQHDTIEAFKM